MPQKVLRTSPPLHTIQRITLLLKEVTEPPLKKLDASSKTPALDSVSGRKRLIAPFTSKIYRLVNPLIFLPLLKCGLANNQALLNSTLLDVKPSICSTGQQESFGVVEQLGSSLGTGRDIGRSGC
jgi:hypothetical protein